MDDKLPNLSGALQLAAAAISLSAAIYLARFKYTFIEELKKLFIQRPEHVDDWPVSRRENRILEDHAAREHTRLDGEIEKIWEEISRIRRTP